jgi:hypothetical protein
VFTKTAIGPLTKRRQLLLAVEALSTSNLERSYHSFTHFALPGSWSDFLNNTAEFMAQDVIFMKLRDSGWKWELIWIPMKNEKLLTMEKMEIATTYGASRDFDNHVVIVHYGWPGRFH